MNKLDFIKETVTSYEDDGFVTVTLLMPYVKAMLALVEAAVEYVPFLPKDGSEPGPATQQARILREAALYFHRDAEHPDDPPKGCISAS